jgi:hypothetical protein
MKKGMSGCPDKQSKISQIGVITPLKKSRLEKHREYSP